jgi:hypothetical protein
MYLSGWFIFMRCVEVLRRLGVVKRSL